MMPPKQTVLLVGATGRTGRLVLEQLLSRGVSVRVIVRSPHKLSPGAPEGSGLTVVKADVLSLSDQELLRQVRGCNVVISCLGHVTSIRGFFGPPHNLVTRVTTRLCHAVESLQPANPVRFILMSSVSVNHPGGLDTRRGRLERVVLWMLRGLLPPARDNQRAADFLFRRIGTTNPFVRWVAVRPDTLLEGDISKYTAHENLVDSLFSPGRTNMANVAHLMSELATDAHVWGTWEGKLPVIVNG